jgi:hypothetical protein
LLRKSTTFPFASQIHYLSPNTFLLLRKSTPTTLCHYSPFASQIHPLFFCFAKKIAFRLPPSAKWCKTKGQVRKKFLTFLENFLLRKTLHCSVFRFAPLFCLGGAHFFCTAEGGEAKAERRRRRGEGGEAKAERRSLFFLLCKKKAGGIAHFCKAKSGGGAYFYFAKQKAEAERQKSGAVWFAVV